MTGKASRRSCGKIIHDYVECVARRSHSGVRSTSFQGYAHPEMDAASFHVPHTSTLPAASSKLHP